MMTMMTSRAKRVVSVAVGTLAMTGGVPVAFAVDSRENVSHAVASNLDGHDWDIDDDEVVTLPCVPSGPDATGKEAQQICWIDWEKASQIRVGDVNNWQVVFIDVPGYATKIPVKIDLYSHCVIDVPGARGTYEGR